MLREFKLPDVGEGLTEGEILQWLVAVGDTVTVNQPLCEVETAKAAVELPSPYAGTVAELKFEPGTTVDVGTPIITIDVGGDEAPAPVASAAPAAPAEDEPAAGLIGGPPPGRPAAGVVGYGGGGAGRRVDRRSRPGRPDVGAGRLRPEEPRGKAAAAAHGRLDRRPRGRRPARGRLRLGAGAPAAAGHRPGRHGQAGPAR